MREKNMNRENILSEAVNNLTRIEIAGDYVLPDYVPDAEKLLMTTAYPKIESQFIGDDRVDYEGSIKYSVLIASEENKLKSVSYSEPFSGSVEAPGISDECFANIVPQITAVNSRLSSPRKLSIKTSLCIASKLYCEKDISPDVNGISSMEDELALERDCEKMTALSIITASETGIPVSEDIELDSASPAISEIIFTNVSIDPVDVRIRKEEAEIKSDLTFTCIYETEDGGYNCITKKIPLSAIIPTEGLYEGLDCSAQASAGVPKVTVQENSYGEHRLIELDLEYDLILSCYGGRDVSIVRDMYSTANETSAYYTDLPVISYRRGYQTNLSVNAAVPRSDVDAEKMKNIFCGNIRVGGITASYAKDKGKLYADGVATITVVSENDVLIENEPLFSSCTFDYPFRLELDPGENPENCSFIANASVLSERFRLDSSNVFADFEVGIRLVMLDTTSVPAISKLDIDSTSPVVRPSTPLTLCYPGKERLWDIAKRYKIPKTAIMNANAMVTDDFSGKNVLIIPRPKAKHAAYSKII